MPWMRQHKHQSAPWWDGRFKKNGPQSIGKSRGGLTTKIHMVAANDRLGLTFCLSPGRADDGKNGQRLLQNWGHDLPKIPLAMDRARVRIPVRSLKNQALSLLFPLNLTVWNHGFMTRLFINDPMKLSVFLEGSKGSNASFQGLKNWISCSLHVFISPLSWKWSRVLTRPRFPAAQLR